MAVDIVLAESADEDVVARPAEERVGSGIPGNEIVPVAANEQVVPVAARQYVVPRFAEEGGIQAGVVHRDRVAASAPVNIQPRSERPAGDIRAVEAAGERIIRVSETDAERRINLGGAHDLDVVRLIGPLQEEIAYAGVRQNTVFEE